MNIQICILFTLFTAINGNTCGPCVCSIRKKYKIANCKKADDLKSIPETLNTDIHALDMEGQSLASLEENNFDKFKILQTLNLRNNEIENVYDHCFRNLTELEILYLSDNSITILPVDIFFDTPKIVEIYLDKNHLTTLEGKLFSNLNRLEILHLQKNEICYVADNCFSNVPSINEINLRSNKLERLPNHLIKEVNSLKIFDLRDNPWDCGQETCHFRENAIKNNWKMPFCETPSNVTGKTWRELKTYTIWIKANKITPEKGENITISCEITACIPPTFKWRTNTNVITSPGTDMLENKYVSTLHVNDINISETYICSVSDCNECREARIDIKVTEIVTETEATYWTWKQTIIIIFSFLGFLAFIIHLCKSKWFLGIITAYFQKTCSKTQTGINETPDEVHENNEEQNILRETKN